MGKELSLARSEEKGRAVLLVRTSTGEFVEASSTRNKRTQESASNTVSKGEAAKDTKAKSKGSRKVERANASSSKPARRRRDNKDRKSDRGDEGEHKSTGRSAQKLGIVHPGSYCDDAEIVPHWWIEVDRVAGGILHQCKFCHKHLWLPLDYLSAERLGSLMKWYGKDEGYCRYLNRHRAAKMLVAKLQDLRRLEAEVADKREFAKLANKVLSDKDYDRG